MTLIALAEAAPPTRRTPVPSQEAPNARLTPTKASTVILGGLEPVRTAPPPNDQWEAIARFVECQDLIQQANSPDKLDTWYDTVHGDGAYLRDQVILHQATMTLAAAMARGFIYPPKPRTVQSLREAVLGALRPETLLRDGPPTTATTTTTAPEDPTAYLAWLGARPLSVIPTDAPPPLLIGRLAPEGHTILFGEGGVGKGTTAAYWICQLVEAGHRVLIVDYEDHPDEWARRIYGLAKESNLVMENVLHVSPLAKTWRGPSGAIWDHADDLRRLAEDFEATYVVIDSIVFACSGSDVGGGDTKAPGLYQGALQQIGLPTLSLAHVTKEGGLKHPFGSIFWHNGARITWSQSKSPNGLSAVLHNKKHNSYAQQASVTMTVEWPDGLPRSIHEVTYSAAMADLIYEALTEPMTATEVATALNEDVDDPADRYKKDSIATALRRGATPAAKTPQRFQTEGGKWSRFNGQRADNSFRGAFTRPDLALVPSVA